MTREELYKKITNIFGNSCLSEDVDKCEFDGNCKFHEKVKFLEVVEEHNKQIRSDAIDECIDILHNNYEVRNAEQNAFMDMLVMEFLRLKEKKDEA